MQNQAKGPGREICVQNVYQGKVMSIWVAWLAGRHDEYVLGKNEKEVRKLASDIIRVNFFHSSDGTKCIAISPDAPDLEIQATTLKEAEEELIYQIKLRRGIVDWKRIAMALAMGSDIDPRERMAIDKEMATWDKSRLKKLDGTSPPTTTNDSITTETIPTP